MLKKIACAVMSCSVSSCGYFDVKPRDSDEGPVIARAFFSNQECVGSKGKGESLFAASAISWAVTKTAEYAVGYVTDAIAAAAKADKETVTITGQNPDYLFKVENEKPKMRGCLYVVVAPRVNQGELCSPSGKGDWYNEDSCATDAVPELVEKWHDWSLGTPTFFAQISFRTPTGGPATTAIPEVYKIYYPKPVSTMKEDKVKGFSILVTASKPTKSTRLSGDTVLEVFIGGDGVTPKTVRTEQSLQTSGLWVATPPIDGTTGNLYAGPVNLTVTVAETPHPTQWLQSVNDFVASHKQDAIDKIVAASDPAAIAKAEADDAVNASKARISAQASCLTYSNEIEKLTEASNKLAIKQTSEEHLRAGYALAQQCEVARNAGEMAAANWKLAGIKGTTCNRDGDPVPALCKN